MSPEIERGRVPPARYARLALSSSHSRWPLHSCWSARHACPATPACPPAVGLRPNRFTGRGQPYPQHFVPRKRFKWYQAYQMRRLVPRKRFRWNKVEFPGLLSSPARPAPSAMPFYVEPPHHASSPRQPRHETPPNKKGGQLISTDRLSCGW